MNTRGKKLTDFVVLALFVGLIFLLGQTPLGLIPLPWCKVTLLCIPVAVGTIFMGLKSGLILGLAFGATSFVTALTNPSLLVGTLMGASPLYTILMTFVPRLCVPVVIHAVYTLLKKRQKHFACAAAAACGSLTNTVLYLGLMLLFYVMCGIDNTSVLTAIAATAGGAGPAEAIAAALITPPVVIALEKVRK